MCYIPLHFFCDSGSIATRCNKHLLGLGLHVKKSLVDAGLIGYQFGTVGVRYVSPQ